MSKKSSPIVSFNLESFDVPLNPHNQIASVISIPLRDVHEDPDQPRKNFNDEDLVKFSQDILHRGVQQPISVKPLSTGIGQYQIIQGARRFRASVIAGLTEIPAIVRVDALTFDDYSQVTENTQREDLSPLDIARFIQRRKDMGESNVYIAEQLKESKEYITKHLAILDAPKFIQEALLNGVIQGVLSTYYLTSIYKKSPDVALQLVRDSELVTQAQILGALKLVNQSSEKSGGGAELSSDTGPMPITNASAQSLDVDIDTPSDTSSLVANNFDAAASAGDESDSKIVAFRVGGNKPRDVAPTNSRDLENHTAITPEPANLASSESKKTFLTKQARLAISGFIQNLGLQLGNKAAKQVVLNHSDAKTLKTLLEGLL